MSCRVLIVDDHPGFRAQARAMLAAAGYQVVGEAADGESAARAAADLSPDVVLLDVQLPDITGFEAARRVRSQAVPPAVILISSRDASDYGSRIGRCGAQGFISKSELSARGLEGKQARMVTLVARDERPLAALIHDPALDQGLVSAAAAAAGIAVENERLHVEIQAQLEEVRASRQRIVEAGDRERRRVERNLHDGAQQRLATLALSLAMLRDREGADPATADSLAQALAELKQAIEELRELARGIHPAILTEEGLPAAVESLADRSPLHVRVAADFDARLPGPIETAAYFVVSEALANVAKYAHASCAWVELSRQNGALRVQVLDDGVGGADPTRGSGLRGLQDRISAVRGSFRVETPPAGGTRVLAEIPCDA